MWAWEGLPQSRQSAAFKNHWGFCLLQLALTATHTTDPRALSHSSSTAGRPRGTEFAKYGFKSRIYAHNATNGDVIWSRDIEGVLEMDSPLQIIDDKYLIVADWAGVVSALDITDGGRMEWGKRFSSAE